MYTSHSVMRFSVRQNRPFCNTFPPSELRGRRCLVRLPTHRRLPINLLCAYFHGRAALYRVKWGIRSEIPAGKRHCFASMFAAGRSTAPAANALTAAPSLHPISHALVISHARVYLKADTSYAEVLPSFGFDSSAVQLPSVPNSIPVKDTAASRLASTLDADDSGTSLLPSANSQDTISNRVVEKYHNHCT